jgi:UDP-3-O-[3-hydroxymyristoyl] glucosamine N-acyltransferase
MRASAEQTTRAGKRSSEGRARSQRSSKRREEVPSNAPRSVGSSHGRIASAENIAGALGLDLEGVPRVAIRSADAIDDASTGSVTWMNALTRERRRILDRLSGALVVVPEPRNADDQRFLSSVAKHSALLVVENPRLVFARILARFFSHLELQLQRGIDPSARVEPSVRINGDVTVGPFCFIGSDVTIGNGSVLHPGVVVHSRSIIGRDCVLKSNAVVGSRGFGFVQTSSGSLEHFPHIGRVVIEDDVEIGACSAIDRPGLGTTRILRGTKIDNLCHVGHNAQVGPHAIVAACTEIGAGVIVAEGAWLGPNSCSIEGVTVGTRSFVGIGSTVLKDVAPGAVVAGSPAEPIEVVRRTRRALRKLVKSSA